MTGVSAGSTTRPVTLLSSASPRKIKGLASNECAKNMSYWRTDAALARATGAHFVHCVLAKRSPSRTCASRLCAPPPGPIFRRSGGESVSSELAGAMPSSAEVGVPNYPLAHDSHRRQRLPLSPRAIVGREFRQRAAARPPRRSARVEAGAHKLVQQLTGRHCRVPGMAYARACGASDIRFDPEHMSATRHSDGATPMPDTSSIDHEAN